MASCWRRLGNLLTECVPSIVDSGPNAVVPEEPPSQEDLTSDVIYQRYQDTALTSSTSMFQYQPVCTSSTEGFGSSGTTRYQAYTVASFPRSPSSFVASTPSNLHDIDPVPPMLFPFPPNFSLSSNRPGVTALSPLPRRRATSCSCSTDHTIGGDRKCPNVSTDSGISDNSSPQCSDNCINRKCSTISCSSNDINRDSASRDGRDNSSTSSSRVLLRQHRVDSASLQPDSSSRVGSRGGARRRASSVSSGAIGVGGRGGRSGIRDGEGSSGAGSSRYLVLRPVTDTITHTIGEIACTGGHLVN